MATQPQTSTTKPPTDYEAFFSRLTPTEAKIWQSYKYFDNEFERDGSYTHYLFETFPGCFQELCECEWTFEKIHDPWFQVWERNSDHHMSECYERYVQAWAEMSQLSVTAKQTISKKCIQYSLQTDPAAEGSDLLACIEDWIKTEMQHMKNTPPSGKQ